MHGLINRSFESFLRITYGAHLWSAIAQDIGDGFEQFEPVLHYDDTLSFKMLDSASARLDKPRATLLEDFGTFLVAAPETERVRRLLRFGGVDYEDFLASLEALRGRARLAVPDLDLPQLDLEEHGGGQYRLICRSPIPGFGRVYLGLLRALADDYGALVLIEFEHGDADRDGDDDGGGAEVLSIQLADASFSTGRAFDLADRAASEGGA